MNESIVSHNQHTILYDNTLIEQPVPALFDAAKYPPLEHGKPGRGNVVFIPTSSGTWVLKHYLRGGMVQRVSHAHYLYLGMARTRMVAEFRLLQRMLGWDLPVPRPVAALVTKTGPTYTGSLISTKISALGTLGEISNVMLLPEQKWRDIGECIARFHQRHIFHADLNADNIMITENTIFLIDFDKGEIRTGGDARWQKDNIARLRRSLEKINNTKQSPLTHWDSLVESYYSAMQTT